MVASGESPVAEDTSKYNVKPMMASVQRPALPEEDPGGERPYAVMSKMLEDAVAKGARE